MTSEKKILSIAILISAILTIVTSSLKEAHAYYHYAFFLLKPLTLILTIAFSRRLYKKFERYHRFITIGLILGLMGDIFLMFDHIKTIYFILGLASFLIGHIFYIIAFLDNHPFLKNKWSILPFFFFGILGYTILKDHVGSLLIPVILYIVSIALMGACSLDRHLTLKNRNSLFAFIGSIFFVISDSSLAFNMFVSPFKLSIISTLSTYYIAQYLIASSLEESPKV